LTAQTLNDFIAKHWRTYNIDKEDVEHLRDIMFRPGKFAQMSDEDWDNFWLDQLMYFRQRWKFEDNK